MTRDAGSSGLPNALFCSVLGLPNACFAVFWGPQVSQMPCSVLGSSVFWGLRSPKCNALFGSRSRCRSRSSNSSSSGSSSSSSSSSSGSGSGS
eukprot:1090582-Amphidinium_carterae.2